MKKSAIVMFCLSLFSISVFATVEQKPVAAPAPTKAPAAEKAPAPAKAPAAEKAPAPAQEPAAEKAPAPAPAALPVITKSVAKKLSPAEKNRLVGEAFLTANKTKPGVVTLPSGLQYKILTEGNGSQPTDYDTVTVDYSGTLVNGKEFDSSYKRGIPANFQVGGVIPGWTQALKLMKVGSTWELYIPAELAYGETGASSVIGPNETLIFKVHLIAINK